MKQPVLSNACLRFWWLPDRLNIDIEVQHALKLNNPKEKEERNEHINQYQEVNCKYGKFVYIRTEKLQHHIAKRTKKNIGIT